MVTPEGTELQTKKQKAGKLSLVLVAAVLGVVGVIGFSALTTPDPEAAPETTTTSTTIDELSRPIDLENFSVSQIATGVPFDWHHEIQIDDVASGNLVSHEGAVYLFTSQVSPGIGFTADIPGSVFMHRPGTTWELVGDLPAGVLAHTMASTAQGLMGIAVGTNGEPATLYQSSDGVTWEAIPLPEIDDSPLATTWGQAAAANNEATVVGLSSEILLTGVVADHYEQTFGTPPNLKNFWPSTYFNGQDTSIVWHGPFGLKLWEFPASEIGLSDSELDVVQDGNDLRILARTRDGDWTESEVDAQWIQSIVAAHDGSISIFGYPQVGGRVRWLSYDGVNWERETSAFTPNNGVLWHGGLVGIYDGGNGQLVISEDGFSWDVVPFDEFPIQFGWWISQLEGGPGGIAAVYDGWGQSTRDFANTPRPTLTKGGSTLTADYSQGRIVIETPTTTASFDMYTEHNDEFFVVDHAAGTISFIQPGTDIVHMTVSIDELVELETGASWTSPTERHTALVYSPEGTTWSIHDVTASFGDGAFIGDIALTTDEIVVTLIRDTDQIFGPVGVRSNLEIWTAPLP